MNAACIGFFALFGVLGLASVAAAEPAAGKFTIGYLGDAPGAVVAPTAFYQVMQELGYSEGRNLTILFRAPQSTNAELPGLAADLVSLKPQALVAEGTPSALALKQATAVIPIVIIGVGNPIGTGLIQSLAHPGGNVTGTASMIEEWTSKRLQMITEVLPGIRCVLYLRNPANAYLGTIAPAIEKTRRELGIEFHVLDAATPDQLDQALAAPPNEHCKAALFLPLDGLFAKRRTQIVEFALRNKIGLFGGFADDARAGALMAFGYSQGERWRVSAIYVDKIFKGGKPADLPVQLPTKFEMVVNLKTAKALGIPIPPAVLMRADEVIE